MAALALCGGCGSGQHERHVEHWNNPGPGILGGAFCPCKGDCKEPDLSHLFQPVAPPVTNYESEYRALREGLEALADEWETDARSLVQVGPNDKVTLTDPKTLAVAAKAVRALLAPSPAEESR